MVPFTSTYFCENTRIVSVVNKSTYWCIFSKSSHSFGRIQVLDFLIPSLSINLPQVPIEVVQFNVVDGSEAELTRTTLA